MIDSLTRVGAGGPTRGVLRTVRVAVLGATSMLLATTAHLVAGGQLPSIGVLLVAGVTVGLIAFTVTSRHCRLNPLIALLGAEQGSLHWLFGSAAGGHCSGPAHHAADFGPLSCSAAPMQMAEQGPLMMLTHVGAVL